MGTHFLEESNWKPGLKCSTQLRAEGDGSQEQRDESPNTRGLQNQPAEDPGEFRVVSMVARDTRIPLGV